jgi:putative hydrolase of the HAD superfamily
MKYRAVIFDLFGTLVDNFSLREQQDILARMASILSAPADEFMRLWFGIFNERATGLFGSLEGNIEHICRKLGISAKAPQIQQAARIRYDFTRHALRPRPDAVSVLSRLKSQGYKTALISDCSAETPTAWKDTPLAPLVDVAMLSCLVGLKKPDPRIYQKAAQQLGVEPQTCLYVGDGSSGELTGAAQVGMHPVLLNLPENNPDAHQIDKEDWNGPAISSLSEVLMLVRLTKQ